MLEGNGPKWLFDLDSLTQSMNYVPVVAGTFSNVSTGIQGGSESSIFSQQDQDCIVMPIWKDASYFDDASLKSIADVQIQDQDGTHDDCSFQDNGIDDHQVNTASPQVNTGSREISTAAPEVNTATPEGLMGPIPTTEDTQEEVQGIDFGLEEFQQPEINWYGLLGIQVQSQPLCVIESQIILRLEEPKKARENTDAPIIEDWVSDDEEEAIPNLLKKGFVDSGLCSRHHVGNIAHLSVSKNLMEVLLLGGGANGGRIHCFDMKNIVPKDGLTCLVAKATSEESMLWHRRLGHVNFKNINKLVKDNLEPLDETSEILKNFIKEIENLVDKKVKIIRSDNGTEFKNHVMDEFCREKGIKREYSVARTPQQNGVAERKNRTLIEAARTMLADSKLPTTFWAEAVSTACYVQNRVLVVKPHNKTPYELFRGIKPAIGFMKPFGCHVTILNTLDKLGKFDGKSDEGFFVGYSLSSKAFRVYNIRTRKVQENLHVGFLENKPMLEGNGPKWLFDLDSLTQTMNYVPVVAGTFSNVSAGMQEGSESNISSQKDQDCIFMPIWKDASYFEDITPQSVDDVQLQDQDGNHDDCSFQDDGIDDHQVNTASPQVNTASPQVNTGSRELSTADYAVNSATSEGLMGPIPTTEDSQQEDQGIELGNLSPSYAVQQKKKGIFISQDKYVHEILKKFNYTDVKSASTPTDLERPLVKDADADDVDEHLYRSMIGSLMYLTASRPDIMFAVCACASLEFCDKHNMVAYLEKSTGSAGFHQIIDFITRSHIYYALTKKPEMDTHFRSLDRFLYANISSWNDQDGISSPSNYRCPKKTAWEQFSSNIAAAVICLATDRKFNFFKMILTTVEVALFPNMLDVHTPSASPSNSISSPTPTPTQPSPIQPSPTQLSPTQPGSDYHPPTPHDSPLHAVHFTIQRQSKDLQLILVPGWAAKEEGSVSTAEVHISTAGGTVTYSRRSAEKRTRQDKGKAILIEEEPKKKSKKEIEQERLSYAEAIRLEEQMHDEQRAQIARDAEIARQWDEEEKKRAMDEAKATKEIDWNDPSVIRYHSLKMKPKSIAQARRNMIKYLKNQGNFKINDFKGMSYNEIRPIFEKLWDFNQKFVPMDADKESKKQKSPEKERSTEKIVEEEAGTQEERKEAVNEPAAKRKKSIPRKTTRKRQKLEVDTRKEELKTFRYSNKEKNDPIGH
ncbi:ribonuclease H-like domain-containing protein [Tanacetum coccineum]